MVETLPLDNFQAKITQEFLDGSAIAPELFEVAIELVSDTEVLPGGEVAYPIHEALNWHLSRFGFQARENLEAALFHNEDGSCWQAKLSCPKRDHERGKTRKYEAPVDNGSRVFSPSVPPSIRQAIAHRYGVDVPLAGSFWNWVEQYPELPVVFTEGGKKALSLLSQGYVAIALYGVNSGYRTEGGTIEPELIPDVLRFCQPQRKIILAFDQDGKPETRRKVAWALSRFGGLMSAAGCEVAIAEWEPEQGKGIDDLRVQCGTEAVDGAIAGAISLQLFLESLKEPSHWEPNQAEYQAACQQQDEQEALAGAQEQERQRQRKDQFRAETERLQAKLNGLTAQPTIKASGRYIPKRLVKLPLQPGIYMVDAGMGAGKTAVAMQELTNQHRRLYREALRLLLVPRNRLGFQAGQTLHMPHHSYLKGLDLRDATLCLESIWKLVFDQLPEGPPLILFDEISATLKQILYGETCRGNQAFILAQLRKLLRFVREQGGWIVLSEDGITNLELDFIREASGLEVVEYLEFKRIQPQPRQYTIYESQSMTLREIQQRLAEGQNLVLASDSKKWLRNLEQMAIEWGIFAKGIWVFDSSNSETDQAKSFSESPQAFIEQRKPRILAYSPSMGSGVSIEDPTGHFSAVAFHLVHLEPRDAKQMCDRLRTDVPRFGYVKERASSDDDLFSNCRPDLILRDLHRNQQGIAKLTEFADYALKKQPLGKDEQPLDLMGLMARLDADKDDPTTDYGFYLKYWSRYKARETYNKLRLRENLISIWEQQGHCVQVQSGSVKQLTEDYRRVDAERERLEAIEFATSKTDHLTPEIARSVLNAPESTPEERTAARKRLLEDKLPGCNLDSSEFVLKVVVQENGRFLKTTELLWLTQNPEAAKHIDRWNWLGAFTRAAKHDEFVPTPQLSVRSGQAKLLSECPLQPFIDGLLRQWDNDSPEAIAVHQWALLHARQFKRYLRITVSEEHQPVQTVNKLLRKLGLDTKPVSRRGSRDDRQRQYAIANLEDVDRDAILKSLTERFLQKCDEKGDSAPVSTTCTKETSSTSYGHTPTDAPSKVEKWTTPEPNSDEAKRKIHPLIPSQSLRRAIS